MLWLHLLSVSCLAEVLHSKTLYKSVSFVVSEANTVHYIQTKPEALGKTPLQKETRKTSIFIYKDRLYDNGAVIYKDEKYSEENTFFFTAHAQAKYYIVVLLENPGHVDVGLDYKIYSGEANRPVIISNNDVEVTKAENKIKKLLDYVKTNISLQNMDEDEDERYKKLYSDIVRRVFYVVLLKIVATTFTLCYTGWKTKKFFSTQGIAGQRG
jgi:CRISPR/Cas system-associated exonuclease Cas4 (RecB family)